jgi:putative transposase
MCSGLANADRGGFAAACLYDLQNPVRAGLVDQARNWEYLGAVVPGYPTLHPLDENFWELFWKLYWKLRGDEP